MRIDQQPIHIVPQVAPGFVHRLQIQKEISELIANGEANKFGRVEGDYSELSFTHHQENLGSDGYRLPMGQLCGIEEYFAQRISQLLQTGDAKPVLAVDIGGMAGLSWCRLAKTFQQQIEQGKVVLAVTNLQLDIDKNLSQVPIDQDEYNFIYDYRPLVNYVQADSSNFRSITVSTLGGTTIPFANNIDILHERLSVSTHSQVPEWDIPQMVVPTLSQRGLYIPMSSGPICYLRDEIKNIGQRRKGYFLAQKELLDSGLQTVNEVEEGGHREDELVYSVYRRTPDAKIKFD